MATILPPREEADGLVPPPGGVTWRIASDARLMAGAGYALMLQVAHPVVGAGVAEHSNFRADPWGRLLRTLDFTTSLVYGGPELAWQTGARVRQMHTRIKGVMPDGTRYHAMEPEAYAWVHATLADSIVRAQLRFVGPMTQRELGTFWSEWRRAGRLLGVRDQDLPEDWSDFAPYFNDMVRNRLEPTESVHDVLAALDEPPPPAIRGLSEGLWKILRVPAVRGGRVGTIGLMPRPLRRKLGLELTPTMQVEFRATAAASRKSDPLLPSQIKTFGPSYLKWRRAAIERGEVASGKGSKFESKPAAPAPV